MPATTRRRRALVPRGVRRADERADHRPHRHLLRAQANRPDGRSGDGADGARANTPDSARQPAERGGHRGAHRDALPQRRDLAGPLPGPGHRLARGQPGGTDCGADGQGTPPPVPGQRRPGDRTDGTREQHRAGCARPCGRGVRGHLANLAARRGRRPTFGARSGGEPVDHRPHPVGRDGEPDADVAAAEAGDRRCSRRSTRPRRSISGPPELPGLMDASVWTALARRRADPHLAVGGADDAGRHGAGQPERRADRDDLVAHGGASDASARGSGSTPGGSSTRSTARSSSALRPSTLGVGRGRRWRTAPARRRTGHPRRARWSPRRRPSTTKPLPVAARLPERTCTDTTLGSTRRPT